jgi:hypothetical protein
MEPSTSESGGSCPQLPLIIDRIDCTTMPDRIRVIEYEVLLWDDERMEKLADIVKEKLGVLAEVGILRCTARSDTKITLVGSAEATRALIASGRASKPGGLVISSEEFPIMIKGWPYRFATE